MRIQELIEYVDEKKLRNHAVMADHPDFTHFYVKYGYFPWLPKDISDQKVFVIAGINATRPNTGQFKSLLHGELLKLNRPIYVECILSDVLRDYLESQNFKFDPAFSDPPCMYMPA